jgi:hypothetical protein
VFDGAGVDERPRAGPGLNADVMAQSIALQVRSSNDLAKLVASMGAQMGGMAAAFVAQAEKPKDAPKYAPAKARGWLKLRAVLDHGMMRSFDPKAVGKVGAEMFADMVRMASDVSVEDSFEYTPPVIHSVVELTLGGNHHTRQYYHTRVMDFARRLYEDMYRGKRLQQVWMKNVTAAQVKRSKPIKEGPFSRSDLKGALSELGTFLAHLGGDELCALCENLFRLLGQYKKIRHLDDRIATWTRLVDVADLFLARWCERVEEWASSARNFVFTQEDLDFAEERNLPEPIPVMVVSLDCLWFKENVDDPLERLVRHGKEKALVDQPLPGAGGSGGGDLERAAREGAQGGIDTQPEDAGQQLEGMMCPGGSTWSAGGYQWECWNLDDTEDLDWEGEQVMVLPAAGGLPERAMVRRDLSSTFCPQARKGLCDGKECGRSHDPEVMKRENALTRDKSCRGFAANGVCPYGKNCRFGHVAVAGGGQDFR